MSNLMTASAHTLDCTNIQTGSPDNVPTPLGSGTRRRGRVRGERTHGLPNLPSFNSSFINKCLFSSYY